MRIAIIGAGAIGGWLGARLAADGHDVGMVARGRTLNAIRDAGLRLTSGGETRALKVAASDDPAELGPQEIVFIALKSPALAEAAPLVSRLLTEESIVVPAMNGVPWWFTKGLEGPLEGVMLDAVNPGGRISRAVPSTQVIGCVVHASCSVKEPGHTVHHTGNGLIVGEPAGNSSARLALCQAVLRDAGFDAEPSPRIQRDVWYKLWGNMTMNPVSALTGATGDRILDDDLIVPFMLNVMAEAAEIGSRIGCAITESGSDRMKLTRKLGAFKTSMLQDVEAGRAIEIDSLLGAPREIAAKVGVSTPYMDALHGLARLFASTQARRRR